MNLHNVTDARNKNKTRHRRGPHDCHMIFICVTSAVFIFCQGSRPLSRAEPQLFRTLTKLNTNYNYFWPIMYESILINYWSNTFFTIYLWLAFARDFTHVYQLFQKWEHFHPKSLLPFYLFKVNCVFFSYITLLGIKFPKILLNLTYLHHEKNPCTQFKIFGWIELISVNRLHLLHSCIDFHLVH